MSDDAVPPQQPPPAELSSGAPEAARPTPAADETVRSVAPSTALPVGPDSPGIAGTPALESPPRAPPPLAAPPAPEEHPVVFHGQADEFFRIWVVNTLLTLVTVGVFFPWAKVRKRRYLRGSTELLGHRFDYRANPARLLIGHVIVLILFLGYSLFGVVYPAIRFGVLALGLCLLPWIVVRSFTFNAHNTVYRGLRFRFNPSLSAALKVYVLEVLLIPATLGLYYPEWQRSKRAYAVGNHRLGDAYFHFDAGPGRFYSTYFLAALIVFAAAMIGGIAIAVTTVGHRAVQPGLVQMIPFFILYGFGFFVGRHLIYARLFNHVWNHTRLDEHRFRARLATGRWLGLQLTNLGAIIASAGLLYPWALVRAQRYAASCLAFVPAGTIDTIERVGGTAGSATGDMAAEFIGIDFGL